MRLIVTGIIIPLCAALFGCGRGTDTSYPSKEPQVNVPRADASLTNQPHATSEAPASATAPNTNTAPR